MNDGNKISTEGLTVVRLLEECVAHVGDQPFLDFAGDAHTYRQLWDRATSYAAGLRKMGVGPEQTVVTMLDNNVDGASLWFASNLVGAVWVPVNTALKGTFLSHVISDSEDAGRCLRGRLARPVPGRDLPTPKRRTHPCPRT